MEHAGELSTTAYLDSNIDIFLHTEQEATVPWFVDVVQVVL